MLSIIFTKRKMLASIYGEKLTFLNIGKNKAFFYSDSMKASLATHLTTIVQRYNQHLKTEGKEIKKPILINIVYPLESKQRDRLELKEYIHSLDVHLQLGSMINLASAYILGMERGRKHLKHNYILLEAFDDFINIHYQIYRSNKILVQHKTVEELGWRAGNKRVLEMLVTSLAKEGFIIDESGEAQLYQQLLSFKKDNTLKISKQKGPIQINASIDLPHDTYDKLMIENKANLPQFLNNEIFERKNIYNLILISNYFDNTFFLNYLCKDLEIKGTSINTLGTNDELALNTIALGAIKEAKRLLTSKQQKTPLHQNRKVKQLFIDEIRRACVDFNKLNDYKSRFIPLGNKLGIPDKVTFLYIKENLQTAVLANELATATINPKTDKQSTSTSREKDFNSNSSSEQGNFKSNNLIVPSEKMEESTIDSTKLPTLNNKTNNFDPLPNLSDYISVEEVFSKTEFLFLKGQLKDTTDSRVFRIINAHEAKDPEKLDRFRKLYKREASYYDGISTIYNLPYGYFYFRDYFAGVSLDQYVKKISLQKKQKLSSFSSSDLKLILLIWKEINGVKFACKNFKENNILISSKLKWNLKREVSVRLVGFDSTDCSHKRMIDDIHQIFERLLGKSLYATFRNHFKL